MELSSKQISDGDDIQALIFLSYRAQVTHLLYLVYKMDNRTYNI